MMDILGMGYSEKSIKPYLKMAVQRIQIANNKKLTSVKHQKKEIANLLGDHKDEKARIKVEHIIRDDFVIEAYELLELLCELLHERIRQITTNKEVPSDLKDTVCSLIWAASNCEISELQEVKKHLTRKYGAEFAKAACENEGGVVNDRLFQKLSYKPPSRLLVTRYLEEIAQVYKVDWIAPDETMEEGELISDPNMPFSTPTGYSVNMAPGSGFTAAYTAPLRAGNVPAAMNADELAELEQFQKHQVGAQSVITATIVPDSDNTTVFAAVPGPPPKFNNGKAGRDDDDSSDGGGGGGGGGGDINVASGSINYASDASPAVATAAPAVSGVKADPGPPVAAHKPASASASASASPSPPPPPPLPTAPAPPASAVAPKEMDPMDAMAARLAALQKR